MHPLKNKHGGALIEFVIALPFLLFLIGGAVDFGILFYNKQILTNASREGARAGIVFEKNSDGEKIIVSEENIRSIIEQYCDCSDLQHCDRLINAEGISLNVNAAGVDYLNYPSDLTVSVSLDNYQLLLSPLLNLFGGSFGVVDISAVTIMRME